MNTHRRGLFRSLFRSTLGLSLAGFVATATLWTAAVIRFLTPNVASRPRGTFKAGRPSDYTPGQVETRHQSNHGVCIVRGTHGGRTRFYALRAACTHLGCATQWDDNRQEFRCPCHGSAFAKDGRNVAGPARRPLARCAIHLTEDGQLEVDATRTFQEQLGEWNNPDCFVEA